MNSKKLIATIVLVSIFCILLGYDYGMAKNKPEITPARIAVVSIDSLLLQSKKHAQWQLQMEEQEAAKMAELQKMAAEIDLLRKDMDTRKVGSKDYLELARQGAMKRATLEATEKFYEQEITLIAQQWTEKLYKEVLVAIEKVATSQNLDMVLAREELNNASSREIMTLIRTSKVLYHNQQLDITNEVLTVLDAAK